MIIKRIAVILPAVLGVTAVEKIMGAYYYIAQTLTVTEMVFMLALLLYAANIEFNFQRGPRQPETKEKNICFHTRQSSF